MNAVINFKDKLLAIEDHNIPLKQHLRSVAVVEVSRIVNVNVNNIDDELHFLNIYDSKKIIGQLLVDTGSEGNVIKANLVPKHIHIDTKEIMCLKGISGELVKTIGVTEIVIF